MNEIIDAGTGEIVMPIIDEINHEHQLCMEGMRGGLEHAIRCGELLIEQKGRLDHGDWLGWVMEHCDFSYREAANYMRVASNVQRVAYLESDTSLRCALRIIAKADPRPKKALPAPIQSVFSWPKDETIIAMWKGAEAVDAGVIKLLTLKRDPITAKYELEMIRKKLNQIIERVNKNIGGVS